MISGRQIGGYEIQEELGRGAMGVVFKARQVSMDRIVAIKFLPKRLAQDERIVARFLREARAAGQLSHPNIVSVHELGVADGLHFIAMEFVDGNSIQKRIKEKGPFSEKESLEIAHQIAEALKMAHSRGILHRDIKPDNFLIDSAGRVRLADLGLASIDNNRSDGSLTQDGTTLGTPHFMAPEQCSGSGTDARSDLYSLGASMFVMASGRTPYEGNTAAAVMVKVLTEKPASLKAVKSELSGGFVALVEKMMHKDPEKRFQNAASAAEAIQLCKSGHYKAVTTPPTTPNKTGANVKPTATKNPGGSTSKTQDLSTGQRAKQNQSKLIPLLMGACAALALIVLLAAYKSRGPQPSATTQPSNIAKNDPLPVRGSVIETTPHPSTLPKSPMANSGKGSDDPKNLEHEKNKHRGLNNPIEQFNSIDDGLTSGRMKLPEALKRLQEFREMHKLKIEVNPGLLRRLNNLEKEIARRQETTATDWKKVSAAVESDVANGDLKEALLKLSAFRAENDGLDDAAKAEEKSTELISELLAGAKKIADTGNAKEAAARLKDFTEIKGVPEKITAAVKSDYEIYGERIKSSNELAGFYETAYQLVLKCDKLERKNFQFSEAVKFCNEYAPRAHYEDNKRDMLELARLFESARLMFNAMRDQINSGNRVELPGLAGFSKNKLSVVKWADEEILYTAGEIKEPQPIKLYSASAPDAILTIAQEMKKPALNTPAGMWDVGLLAFAFGNVNMATKYMRDAMTKDEALASRPQVMVAVKLLKPVEIAAVKSPEKQPEVASPVESTREKDAESCLRELQEAVKAGDKSKLAALRSDMATKFADTDFFKAHKKEFDELAAGGTPATPEVPKVTQAVPDKTKPDGRPAQEKEAHDALARLGWPVDNITGTWTLYNKEKNIFKVEGVAGLTFPALEGDIDVYFQMLDSSAKLRVLTRVIDKTSDRFVGFGSDKGIGFGADISASSVYVYLDVKSKTLPSMFGDPMKVQDWKSGAKIHVRHRDGEIAVTYGDYQTKKNSGQARSSGDIRVIVNGPMLLIPQMIKPAKLQ